MKTPAEIVSEIREYTYSNDYSGSFSFDITGKQAEQLIVDYANQVIADHIAGLADGSAE